MASMSSLSHRSLNAPGDSTWNVALTGAYATGGVPLLPAEAFGLSSISNVDVDSPGPNIGRGVTSRGHGATYVAGKLKILTAPNGSELAAGTILNEDAVLVVS